MLVHGLGCDQRIWSALVPLLSADHHVVTFDLTGSGRAESTAWDPPRYATLEGFARDIIDVVGDLGLPGPPVIVGHSLGANLALQAAVAAPGLAARLILLLTTPRFLDDPPDYRGGFDESGLAEILGTMDRNFVSWAGSFAAFVAPQPETAHAMTEAITATDPGLTRHLTELAFRSDLRPLLPRVGVPTLCVQSTHDPIIPRSAADLLVQSIPGARQELLSVPGHCPHLSHPRLVASVIRHELT